MDHIGESLGALPGIAGSVGERNAIAIVTENPGPSTKPLGMPGRDPSHLDPGGAERHEPAGLEVPGGGKT